MSPTPALSRITETDYLATSFPDVDAEFNEGRLVQRAMPDYFHGWVQSNLSFFFKTHQAGGVPVRSATEVRHRLSAERYIVPDFAAYRAASPVMRVPDYPPLVAVEILSPSDTMSSVREKLDEYRAWGVPNVWLVDPDARVFYVYGAQGLHEVPTLPVPELNLEVTPADVFAFE